MTQDAPIVRSRGRLQLVGQILAIVGVVGIVTQCVAHGQPAPSALPPDPMPPLPLTVLPTRTAPPTTFVFVLATTTPTPRESVLVGPVVTRAATPTFTPIPTATQTPVRTPVQKG